MDRNASAAARVSSWQRWGPLRTLLLILFLSAAIVVIALCGLLIFVALGGFWGSEAKAPSPRSLIFITSYACAVVAALYAYSSKLRLGPLMLLLIAAIAGAVLAFGPL